MWILGRIFIIPTVCHNIFFVEKDFNNWDVQIHCPRNYLQIFYVAALIEEYGTNNNYPLVIFEMASQKIQDRLI